MRSFQSPSAVHSDWSVALLILAEVSCTDSGAVESLMVWNCISLMPEDLESVCRYLLAVYL